MKKKKKIKTDQKNDRISKKGSSHPKGSARPVRSAQKKDMSSQKGEGLRKNLKKQITPEKTNSNSFPIIAIGASAGGLEAFEQFFSKVPPDTGAAYVVIQHLDPSHPSIMADLLRKYTTMKVLEVDDGMRVEPNHIYTIPPNKDMTIEAETLKLFTQVKPHGLRMPIDLFFRSLADDYGDRAIGIILSGSGTDGTLGLRAINGAGGISIVQDPASAKYDGMPRSAIETGLADYVMPIERIPEQLIDYIKHLYPGKRKGVAATPVTSPVALQRILHILKTKTGNDFSGYKKSTIHRRIERRMNLHSIENVSDYVRYLQEHPEEVRMLFKELLIVVTSFFRDPEAFDVLKKRILPGILEGKPENYTIRIWVPGCATGEEVYSIAIVLRECMDEIKREFNVQIFGTDIDSDAIDTARNGIYRKNIILDVSQRRLKRFFVMEDDSYRIKKDIREQAVFAVHNIVKDPPFTKMDLISCRNLLIYLDTELQNKLIPVFQYSLKSDGILFLGPSESIGGFADLFTVIDKKWKFYKNKGTTPAPHDIPLAEPTGIHAQTPMPGQEGLKKIEETKIEKLAHEMLLESFAPPSVIIDKTGEILYIHGRTGKYLEPAHGRASLNINDMVREGIQYELHSAIHNAITKKKDIAYEKLKVKTNGGVQTINLTVKPVTHPKSKQTLMIVVFEDIPNKHTKTKKKSKSENDQSKRIETLEWELKYTKEDLQSTLSELQASNEELRSFNEELQSTNEELQSTNEELETSKEELQSVNEELVTVNTELQSKIEQLSRSENDMKNLLDSTKIGTIFLDNHLNIKRFTSEAKKVFNLIPTDIGRPIHHIVSNLEYNTLIEDVQEVLDNLVSKEFEVQTKEKHWYLMRIIPYRTEENVIDGVVITFTSVHKIKKAENELKVINDKLRDARDFSEAIVETIQEPLMVLNSDLRVVSANQYFYRIFQTNEEETIGRYLYGLGNKQWDIPELRTLLEDILPKNSHFENFKVSADFQRIGKKTMRLNARRIVQKENKSGLILLVINVT